MRRHEDIRNSTSVLWSAYWENRSIEARNDVVNNYRPLVKKIAGYFFSRRTGEEIEYDDVLQFAYMGLIESVERFMPDSEAAFETYASYRIKGAILNGLEKVSERREQIAFRNKTRRDRLDSLKSKSFNDELDVFDQLVELTLGLAVGFMLDNARLYQEKDSAVKDNAYWSLELSSLKANLTRSIDSLAEKEKMIIYYHYFQEMKFSELASMMGITKGRVSQLHKKALMELKTYCIDTCYLDDFM